MIQASEPHLLMNSSWQGVTFDAQVPLVCRSAGMASVQSSSDFPLSCKLCLMPSPLTWSASISEIKKLHLIIWYYKSLLTGLYLTACALLQLILLTTSKVMLQNTAMTVSLYSKP
jgi:hypothetical protein